MSNFAPAISMKRRTTRLAAAVMTSGALLAVGLGGGSTASADQPTFSCSFAGVAIVCDSLNGNTVNVLNVLNGNEIDVNVLSGEITGIDGDLTVAKVGDVLSDNNVECNTFVVTVGGIPLTGTCNW